MSKEKCEYLNTLAESPLKRKISAQFKALDKTIEKYKSYSFEDICRTFQTDFVEPQRNLNSLLQKTQNNSFEIEVENTEELIQQVKERQNAKQYTTKLKKIKTIEDASEKSKGLSLLQTKIKDYVKERLKASIRASQNVTQSNDNAVSFENFGNYDRLPKITSTFVNDAGLKEEREELIETAKVHFKKGDELLNQLKSVKNFSDFAQAVEEYDKNKQKIEDGRQKFKKKNTKNK